MRPARRDRTSLRLRNNRSWCETADSPSDNSVAMSHTHNSARERASRMRTRVGSPSARNVSASALADSAGMSAWRTSRTCRVLPWNTSHDSSVTDVEVEGWRSVRDMTSERVLRCSYYAREWSGRKRFVNSCPPELKFRLYIPHSRNLERGAGDSSTGSIKKIPAR